MNPAPLVERLAEHEWLNGIGKCLCGWEPTYPESMGPGDAEVEIPQWREHAARALMPIVEQAQAEALRETADRWTQRAWSDVMLPKPAPPAVPVIAYANRVGDWLRARASGIGGEE